MDEKLVCPCGLTCCDCLFYQSEIYETAQKLSDLIKLNDLDSFFDRLSSRKNWEVITKEMHLNEDQAWEKMGQYFDRFKDMAVFMNMLDGIIKLQCKTTCQETGGCSMGGSTHQCDVLKCVKFKGYHGCWQCDAFENCEKLKFVKKQYGFIIEANLRTAKEKGVAAVESHGNRYYAWQRKKHGEDI